MGAALSVTDAAGVLQPGGEIRTFDREELTALDQLRKLLDARERGGKLGYPEVMLD